MTHHSTGPGDSAGLLPHPDGPRGHYYGAPVPAQASIQILVLRKFIEKMRMNARLVRTLAADPAMDARTREDAARAMHWIVDKLDALCDAAERP